MSDEPTVVCAGCGLELLESAAGTAWLDTPIGLTTVKTHRDQECGRRAAEQFPEQPTKRIPRPLTKEEKAAGG